MNLIVSQVVVVVIIMALVEGCHKDGKPIPPCQSKLRLCRVAAGRRYGRIEMLAKLKRNEVCFCSTGALTGRWRHYWHVTWSQLFSNCNDDR